MSSHQSESPVRIRALGRVARHVIVFFAAGLALFSHARSVEACCPDTITVTFKDQTSPYVVGLCDKATVRVVIDHGTCPSCTVNVTLEILPPSGGWTHGDARFVDNDDHTYPITFGAGETVKEVDIYGYTLPGPEQLLSVGGCVCGGAICSYAEFNVVCANPMLDPVASCVTAKSDSDGDGRLNDCDNCPAIANVDQQDIDGDGVGDFCDNCPVTPNAGQDDTDADGVGDACAPARSHIHYLIELGGNNHAELFTPEFKPRFTPGSRAPGQQFTAGSIITWDVRVSVSGRHDKPDTPGHGLFTNGAEGLSFDLELRENSSTGPLVDIGAGSATSAGWFSSVEIDQNAAFACSFDIGGNGHLGGRLINTSSAGGPGLDYYEYPAAASRPAGTFIPRGMVGSQTAVYFEYSTYAQTAGVGISGPAGLTAGGCPGLGILPVFEGQINTTGLSPGTYVLKLIPRGGNILPGNFNCPSGTPTKLAVKANELHGDEISFSLTAQP